MTRRPDISEFRLYAVIDGRRYDAGTIGALSAAESVAELPRRHDRGAPGELRGSA